MKTDVKPKIDIDELIEYLTMQNEITPEQAKLIKNYAHFLMSERKKPQPIIYDLLELMPILNVSRRTLYRYVKSGELKANKIGKTWRVTYDDLTAFIKGERGTNGI